MSLYITKTVDFQHIDNRGRLTQLIHGGFKQVNVLESFKGTNRGSHFHKHSVEAFYVVFGSVEVTFRNKTRMEKRVFEKGNFFEIHPFVLHNMFFLEDCLMIQMYDEPVENADGTKDIFTEEEF